ncbi:MAG: apolipoprotein N-acyltransferase [Kiritimatiellae bacterium]|nr:apolipoprotein N-acyltransferase [Kiritimatiellia bacterium]
MNAKRTILPLLAAAAGGLALRAAFPPFSGQGAAAWIAPVPLFLATRLLAPKRAALFGFVWGFAFFASALAWFVPLVGNGGPWPVVLLGEVGLSAWCALFPALAAAALSVLRAPWRAARADAAAARDALWDAPDGSPEEDAAAGRLAALRRRLALLEAAGPVAAALLWAGSEWLRATAGGGFAWYCLGASQLDFAALAQIASAGGVFLVSAAVALLADALAGVSLRVFDSIRRAPGATRRHFDLTVALALLLCAFFWGKGRLERVRAWRTEGARPMALAAVDPDLPCIFSDNAAEVAEGYERLYGNSLAILERARCDLMVWPETCLEWPLPCAPYEEALRGNVCARFETRLLAGSTLVLHEGPKGEILSPVGNAAWVFSAEGTGEPYLKRHLIPFGEFVPLDEHLTWLQKLSPSGVSCTPGRGPRVFEIPLSEGGAPARVSPLICFEDTVPGVARESARGADLLATISNDAWFRGSCEAEQHHLEASWRAIENGLPVLRVSNTGGAAVVDPAGATIPFQDNGTLWLVLPDDPPRSLHARCGDWLFGVPCAALLLAALAAGAVSAKRRRG